MPNNNTDYWTQRSERRILNAEKTAQEMLKDLKKLYQQTIERINKEIEAFYGRYASDTGLSIADVKKLLTTDELKQFRREVEEYYKELSKYPYDPTYRERLKNAIYTTTTKDGRKLYSLRRNVSRLDYIKMQMENAIETLYARENEAFTTNLSKTYEDTYMRSVFDTQQATGVFQPFNALNSPIIQKTVQQKWLGDNYSDRIWSDKNKLIDTLETTFSQGVALGRNPRVIARDISKATGVKYSNCERLARTEFNHIANEATRDGYTQTDGLDKYRFVATLDSRTSAICQSLSGKVFLVKEAEVGVNYPSMHPNCYIEGTEIFTNKGWKRLQDCKIFDKCFSWNLKNNKYEFIPVIRTISKQVDENLLRFSYEKELDVIVTLDHKMVVGGLFYNFDEPKGLIKANSLLKIDDFFKKDYCFYLGCGKKISLSDINIESIPYKGIVYCVELLKNHTLLVKYNNCVCWCGNCRSTTIPYLEDMDLSKMEQMATDPKTGKSYYVPASMNYEQWKSSLTEEQGKYYYADRKARQQYSSDKKQLAEYRKLATQARKQGNGDLFEGLPTRLADFQSLKYMQPEKYQIYVDNAKIARSPTKD